MVYTASGRDWRIVGGFDHGMVDAVLANNNVLCLGRRWACISHSVVMVLEEDGDQGQDPVPFVDSRSFCH